jgi:hypothetical protein
MSGGRDYDDAGGPRPNLSLGQRLLAALPKLGRGGTKVPLVERFKEAVVKPVEPSAAAKAKAADVPMTVEEMEDAVAYADDKERLTGLLLAPFAGGIAILVIHLMIANDPVSARLKSGAPNPHYISPGLLHELLLVLLAMALLMLGLAFYRKRLFLGIVMALYGLAIFNLHYWGFGIPYILAGAWLLIQSYRLQRDLKEARGEVDSGRRGQTRGRGASNTGPRPNKRYTPPTSTPKRPLKPGDEKKAG